MTANPLPSSKKHYPILDGLRGVAAFMVVIFHTCEAHANDNRFTQSINHGYLAVDFFFLLSGFVIAYAYDDRWGSMTQWDFYKRRLIRLQPMVVMGSVIGAALFYFQSAPIFPLVSGTPVWKVLLLMVVGCTLLPVLPSMDVRGWQEMHPLDGPAWSLFFEYIANILYAAGVRKLSNRALAVVTFLSALFLLHLTIAGPRGDVVGGWTVDQTQLHIGFARLFYPFFAGMLLMRLGTRISMKVAFPLCSVAIIVLLSLPRFGGPAHLWVNGLYESVCIILLFPLMIAVGAGSEIEGGWTKSICKFFGEISYPLYITHYPLIYIYTAWVSRNHISARVGAPFGVLLFCCSVAIAYICLRFYDKPARAWLAARFLSRA